MIEIIILQFVFNKDCEGFSVLLSKHSLNTLTEFK